MLSEIRMTLQKINRKYINIFLVACSGVLSNFSYPEFNLFWVQFFSLIPIIYVLSRETKLINAMGYSVLFGVIFYGILCFWLKIFHVLSLPAILLGFSVYFSMLGLGTKYLLQKYPKAKVFIIPSVWTAVEYIRSAGFLGFPWGLTAHSQWNFLPFIQVADIFGMWIITFLVVLINTILLEMYLNIRSKKNVKLQAVVLGVLIIFPLIYGFIRINYFNKKIQKSDKITLALIQPNVNPNLPWDKIKYSVLSKLTILSERANLCDPDLIVWPESAIQDYIKYYYENSVRLKKDRRFSEGVRYAENVFRLSKDLNNYIFIGLPDYIKTYKNKRIVAEDYNSAVLINSEPRITGVYHKIHLVPFGEWFPFRIGFIKKILEDTWAGNWTPGRNYTVFKIFKKDKEFRFAGLICYEGVFGDLCRKFVFKDAEFLLNITNDAWSYTRVAELQHLIADVFRTIENRVPMGRSANSGATAVINQYGKVISLFPLFKEGYLIDNIYIEKGRKLTIYTKYGDFFPKFLLILNLALLLYAVITRYVIRKVNQ